MYKNLQKLINKVEKKYYYEVPPVPYGMIMVGEKPLTNKAKNIVLKEIKRQLLDPSISSGRYKYLLKLLKKYHYNVSTLRVAYGSLSSDFDGDIPSIEKIDGVGKTISGDFEGDIFSKHYVPRGNEGCVHRFENGDSAFIEIDDCKCRCELCNLELSMDIIDDSYIIYNSEVITKKINELDLETLLDGEDE